MKNSTKLILSALSILTLAELSNEINYLFEAIFSSGNKEELAKCTNLSLEEKIIEEDNKNEALTRIQWENTSRNLSCYVRGYDDAPIYCKIYLQKEFSNKWVLAVHGYGGNGSTLAYASQKFYDKGYNVVVPDLRGHGKSGGRYIGMGEVDSKDITNIVNLIIKGNRDSQIILFGVSMGAATILLSASHGLPSNVKAVISDCSFESANKIIAYEIMHNFKIPPYPLVNILSLLCITKAHYNLCKASPIKAVENIKIPTLFIHGSKDCLVPTQMVYNLYQRAKCPKALMIIDNAGHGVSALVNSKRYWKGVFAFLQKIY